VATRPDLASLLARSAREINTPGDLDATLVAVVESLRGLVPGSHHVGVSLLDADGHPETRAATDDLVWELDHLQRTLSEGPVHDAVTDQHLVAADRLAHEQRWPAYVALAVPRGVRAQLAVRLSADERTWGGLSVYAMDADRIDPDVVRGVTLFAAHAAVAVERSHREDNLKAALRTRKMIGQAVGIAMERFGLDEEMAFRYLVRLSSNRNVKLRDIARELIAEVPGRPRGEE
jgi:GAF domain-containing protein